MTLPPIVEVAVVVLAQASVAWAFTYLVHSSTALAAAAALDRVQRIPPAWRSAMWRAALMAPVITATLQTLLPHFARPLAVGLGPASTLLGSRPSLALAVVMGWSVTLLVGTLRLLRAARATRRALGTRRAARSPERIEMVARAAEMLGLRRTPRVTTSVHLASPAALAPAEVCLPAGVFDALPADEREALVAHEVAHLVRRDPLWGAVGAAVATLCVVQPLNRMGLRRMRWAAEHAADALAVRSTGDAPALARALGALAIHALGGVQPRTAATGSPLIDRMTRLLDGRASRSHAIAHHSTLALVTAFVVACHLLGPGARFSFSAAGRSIPWLAPSPAPPNARMLEVRAFTRQTRHHARSVSTRASRLVDR